MEALMRIVLLDPDTPLAETLLAKPPQVLRSMALLAGGLLAAAAAWAYLARVDLGVSAPVRIRPSDAPCGNFDAVSGQRISASVGGRVADVCRQAGDEVQRGDILVRFDLSRIDADIVRLDAQGKALCEEAANLETILVELDRQEQAEMAKIRAAAAEAEQALRAERDRCRLEEERRTLEEAIATLTVSERRKDAFLLREQVALGISPRIDFERAERAVRESEARLDQARLRAGTATIDQAERRLDTVRAGAEPVRKEFARDRAEQLSRLSMRRRDLDASRQSLEALKRDREASVVRAPAAGLVTQVDVRPGDVLEPGRPMLALAGLGGFRVDGLVGSGDIARVRPGMKARVMLEAFDSTTDGTLEATVSFVSPDAQPAGRHGTAFAIRLTLDQPQPRSGARVKLGMTGRADIVTGRERLLWVMVRSLKDPVVSP
jgi:multidrug resistance efflux pump